MQTSHESLLHQGKAANSEVKSQKMGIMFSTNRKMVYATENTSHFKRLKRVSTQLVVRTNELRKEVAYDGIMVSLDNLVFAKQLSGF